MVELIFFFKKTSISPPQNTRPDTRICTVSSGDLYQAGDVLQEEAGDFLTRCQVPHLFQPDVSMQDSNDEPVREGGSSEMQS